MADPLMDFKEDIVELCEGNPGCLTIICQLLSQNPENAKRLIEGIRFLNLRGLRLWTAYKNVLNKDINVLATRLLDQDKNLVEDVRKCRL